LAAACGCSIKTIRRDLDRLESLGARCPWDNARKSYVLEQPLPELSVELSLPEVAALALLGQSVLHQAGLPQAAQARSALDKLAVHLPLALREEMTNLRGVITVETALRRDYSGAPLPELVKAARQGRTVHMLYYSISRNSTDWRRVDPYGLALQGGYLNLVAYSHEHQEVRLFALDGVQTVEVMEERFRKPRDFSLASFLEGAVLMLRGEPTEILVRFDSSIARWARRYHWGFTHSFTAQADGSLLLRGTVSGLQGIRNELLRWGAKAEVLEPSELRQIMHREAAAMLATYTAETE
ncbi:MAG: WYL domain-containing protein, partial [Armatimonadota bacterium]|nr:WYL domain-containing protein [Armatimonadota bacterium]